MNRSMLWSARDLVGRIGRVALNLAVKVIKHYGDEVMKAVTMPAAQVGD